MRKDDSMAKHGQFAIIPARALDDVRFDKNERHLRALLVLGTYADRDGWCYPSLATIAERLSVTRPTASNTMRDLEDWGYILIVRRLGSDGEGNQSNKYRIIHDAELPVKFDRMQEKHPVKSASMPKKHPVKNPLVEVVQNDPINDPIERGGAKDAPTPSMEYKQEQTARTIKSAVDPIETARANAEFEALADAGKDAVTTPRKRTAGVASQRDADKAEAIEIATSIVGVLCGADVQLKECDAATRGTAKYLAGERLTDIRNGVYTRAAFDAAVQHYRNGGRGELESALEKTHDDKARLFKINDAIGARLGTQATSRADMPGMELA